MSEKKTILVLIDWYLPGTKAGGPVRSVWSMVQYLKKDFNFKIVTFDTDLHETEPYAGIPSYTWIKEDESVSVYYLKKQGYDKEQLTELMLNETYDIIYLNSFYSQRMSIEPLIIRRKNKINKPLILAPRGMLGKGALSIKPFKKKVFMFMAKMLKLHYNITWQASSEHEKEDIIRYAGKNASIKVAGNLSWFKVEENVQKVKIKNELNLFFLSRIVPIKNLHLAIGFLKEIPSGYKINYDVFGPMEDQQYWNECEQLISTLPPNISVNYKGTVERENLPVVLKNYHALLMPTANENFGHSIIESLACGCPVIISDQTPWKNLQEKNIGADISINNRKEFIRIIEKFAGMDAGEFQKYSLEAAQFAKHYFENDSNVQLHKEMFNSAR